MTRIKILYFEAYICILSFDRSSVVDGENLLLDNPGYRRLISDVMYEDQLYIKYPINFFLFSLERMHFQFFGD